MSAKPYGPFEGDRIGEFPVDRVLGEGSFGITYLAKDLNLGRPVAIKEFYPHDFVRRDHSGTIVPQGSKAEEIFHWALGRFSDEAQTLAKFAHRNIVPVFQFIPNLHGTAYIVMEYVEGVTLEDWVRQGLPGREDTLSVFRQLLDGCSAMHQIGILHRDIKPKNIMLRTKNGHVHAGVQRELTPVLIDFGSSRDLALQQDGFSALVTDGFSPPEQYSRNSLQGEPVDIYALACTFYYLLTGLTPPTAAARFEEPLAPVPAARVALFGNRLVRAVLTGMELRVGNRPSSIAAWRKSLGLDEPQIDEGPDWRRRALIGAAAATLAGLGGAAWLLRPKSALSNFARPLNVAWQHELGSIYGDSYPQVRTTTAGGAIVAANVIGNDTAPSMRALRIAANGNLDGDWRDSNTEGMATTILATPDGGAFIGGGVGGKATLVRLGSDWREIWRKEVGSGGITAILPNDTGIIMGIEGLDFTGAEIVAVDKNGNPAWRTAIDKGRNETIQRMIALRAGGYAALGWGVESRDTPNGKLNQNYTFVALLDSEGNSRNRPQTKGLGAATGWAIAEADGIIYVSGWTNDGRKGSSARMFLWAIDYSGATQWLRWDYPSSPSSGHGLAAADGGMLYVAGWSGEPQQMRIAQIGPNGDLNWDMIAPAIGKISTILDLALKPSGSGYAIGAMESSNGEFQLLMTKLDI